MTTDQITIFAILGAVMVLLVWGRWRYDLVAFCALLAGLITGVVDSSKAFTGFGHPATAVIAMVLIVSRGLSNSGAIDVLARQVMRIGKTLTTHILVLSGLGAVLSALMNNVAALTLLMPIDLEAARKAKRSAALTLMPLSFATILGGMVTLIGTPPNIIIAAYRGEAMESGPYGMFDFAPVGGACAVVGLLFVALIGWRLLPKERTAKRDDSQFDLEAYVAEAAVAEGSPLIGQKVRELDEVAAEDELDIVGLVRHGRRLPGMARHAEIHEGDLLVIKGGPSDLERFIKKHKLQHAATEGSTTGLLSSADVAMVEVVVPPNARAAGRSALDLRLKHRFGIHLLGISRSGATVRERLGRLRIQAGDVLLLQGNANELPEVVRSLGCLPLAERDIRKAGRTDHAWFAVLSFALAVALASADVLSLPVALAGAAALMVLRNIVPLRELYDQIEWPVIVLLGSMIPLGEALDSTGATQLIAQAILNMSAGAGPVVVLVLLMVVTMTLSDVMNNTATTIVAAPIALDLARRLEVNPDAFLMTVAIAASCAFLTPIGHKNNTLILGPGGYRFGDYWRMGLPLEALIIVVAVPMILWVWPL